MYQESRLTSQLYFFIVIDDNSCLKTLELSLFFFLILLNFLQPCSKMYILSPLSPFYHKLLKPSLLSFSMPSNGICATPLTGGISPG